MHACSQARPARRLSWPRASRLPDRAKEAIVTGAYTQELLGRVVAACRALSALLRSPWDKDTRGRTDADGPLGRPLPFSLTLCLPAFFHWIYLSILLLPSPLSPPPSAASAPRSLSLSSSALAPFDRVSPSRGSMLPLTDRRL